MRRIGHRDSGPVFETIYEEALAVELRCGSVHSQAFFFTDHQLGARLDFCEDKIVWLKA